MYRPNHGRPRHPDVLTPAEWRVLAYVRAGYTNAAIAEALGLSINTIRTHVSAMLGKLDLPDRHSLGQWPGTPRAASRRLLDPSLPARASSSERSPDSLDPFPGLP